MKNNILYSLMLLLLSFTANGQTTGTLYKAGQWADIKGKGGWAEAMDNPTQEKVEILVTNKYIKVTFGTKVYSYEVVSIKRFSEAKMDYTVKLKGKSYVLSIGDMPNGTKTINIDGEWMVNNIKDIQAVQIE